MNKVFQIPNITDFHSIFQKRYTFLGYLIKAVYIILLALLIAVFISGPRVYVWIIDVFWFAVASVLLGVIVLYIYRRHQFAHRKKVIAAMTVQNNWKQQLPQTDNTSPNFVLSSIGKLSNGYKNHQKNCVYAKEWAYCDYSYDVYRKTKYGDYKETEVIYALMGTTLPRKLPNIVFDSLRSRRRQFKVVYDKSQLHMLEGNFDKYFATYFPKYYEIDSLSFITPDVMEALIEAGEYDIEIIDNNLFIFGPVKDPHTQIPEMSRKLARIKKELLDNILTYRDQRLPYHKGRQGVAIEGARLASAQKKWWIAVIALGIYFVVRLLAS